MVVRHDSSTISSIRNSTPVEVGMEILPRSFFILVFLPKFICEPLQPRAASSVGLNLIMREILHSHNSKHCNDSLDSNEDQHSL